MSEHCENIIIRFQSIVERYPDNSAYKYLEKGNWHKVSYASLLKEAMGVACMLSKCGVQSGDAVLLPSVRTSGLLAELLGILWVGGHYVFLDPDYPEERQNLICKATGACVGIFSGRLPDFKCAGVDWHPVLTEDYSGETIDVCDDPELPAYVMFTSGSTGAPKGVAIPRRSITRLVTDTDYIEFSENERFLQMASLNFDASTLEIWGPLLNGGTCVLYPESSSFAADDFSNIISSQKITTLWLTTSLYNNIISKHPEALTGIKQLLVGGESLSVPHVIKGLEALPKTRIFNGYGPTENTTFTTIYPIPRDLPKDTSRIPIGFPINGTQCQIFDSDLKPITEKNSAGELITFGHGVGLGYIGQPDLTAERFIDVTCADGVTRRGYRTGDLVKQLEDGSYDFLERNDKQVKIDGHRIEPGEIEAKLNELVQINEARVVVHTGPQGQKRLTAYLTSKDKISAARIRQDLLEVLPSYMVPHFIIQLPELPMNQNGKLDKSRLPNPFESSHEKRSISSKSIADCWTAILGRRVDDDVNFLDAGGTSLEAIALTEKLEEEFSLPLKKTFIYEYPSIRSQALFFKDNTGQRLGAQTIEGRNPSSDIAVIGLSCRFPGSSSINAFWDNLISGKESVTHFEHSELDPDIPDAEKNHKNYVKSKGIVEDFDKFDADFFSISPTEAEVMDPQQRLLLELTWHALEDAGYPGGDKDYRTGIYAGANWPRYFQQYILPNKELLKKFGQFNASLANESDFFSTRISHKLDLKGPSVNVFAACSTGLVAIAQACTSIEIGECEMAAAAAISIATPVKSGYLYQEGGMLSADGHCRPFDKAATGTTFNDGAGVVILKRLDLAERDNDSIYCVIKGHSINNDGKQKASFTAPSVSGQVAVYDAAISRSGIDPQSVGFIETHGTATPMGDPIEVESLRQSYGRNGNGGNKIALGSVKSNIGHTIHASGIAGFIKATMAVKKGQIPPTVFFKEANPKLDLDNSPFYVNSKLVEWQEKESRPRRAAVSSLGVGGTNAHIILEEYECKHQGSENTECSVVSSGRGDFPLLISAKSKTALEGQIKNYAEFLSDSSSSAEDISIASIKTRQHFEHRALVFGDSGQTMSAHLMDPKRLTRGSSHKSLESKIVFMFTGQGAQRMKMGHWLYHNEPTYRKWFDLGRELIIESEGWDIALLIKDGEDRKAPDINQTAIAQPSLFILEYGLARILMEKGVVPDLLIGHSIGEFAAAAISGILSFESALKLVLQRGKFMQSMPVGSMLAVKTGRKMVDPLLPDDISVSVINTPELTVVSGRKDAVLSFKELLDKKQIESTLLKTSHAFHSSMMDEAVKLLQPELEKTTFDIPKIPIISTATGSLLSQSEATSPDYWASELRNPVKFRDALVHAVESADGAELAFVEVGPGTTLSSLAKSNPELKKTIIFSALPENGIAENSKNDLCKTIGNLWVNGFKLNWEAFFSPERSKQATQRVKLPLYAFDKKRFWADPVPSQETLSPKVAPKFHDNVIQQKFQMTKSEKSTQIQNKLIGLFEDITGYDLDGIEPETHFSEAGLDSILLTQAANTIAAEFDVDIIFRQLVGDYSCLSNLADYIISLLPDDYFDTSSATPTNIPQGELSAPATLTMPAAVVAPIAAQATGNAIQDLINAQLIVMQQQLQAMSGVGGAVAPVVPPSPQKTETAKAPSPPATTDGTQAQEKPKHTPGTRIARKKVGIELSRAQKEWLDDVMAQFQKKYAGSKAYAQKYRKILADPRTVSGFNPTWKEIIFPIVTNRSKGSKLWDIDGNELIDTSNGFGPIFFGHSPDFVTEAVKEQMDRGVETGPQSDICGEVAELFCELTGHERCTFSCTGSEAVLGAMRLARAVSGRDLIITFEGSYHGIVDEVINRTGKDYQALPGAPGIPANKLAAMKVLPWATMESLEIIKNMGKKVAAVLVEPVQSRKPEFHDGDFLKKLREVTAENGVALILDEVVTGFRVHAGGIKQYFDIDADMCTYGKVVGGGYSIGIIGGKRKYMDALDGGYWQYGDDSIPETGVTFFAGTFVRHPLSLAAARAVMQKIRAGGESLYQELSKKTSDMARSAREFIQQLKTKVTFEEFTSFFYVAVPTEAHWGHMLFTLMQLEGIHIQQYRPNFLTTEHSPEDVDKILSAFKKSLALLVSHGLIEGDAVEAKKALKNNKQDMPPGARLGKNERGEPAWFIQDPKNKSKYIEVATK